jgi:hypothetical protein
LIVWAALEQGIEHLGGVHFQLAAGSPSERRQGLAKNHHSDQVWAGIGLSAD